MIKSISNRRRIIYLCFIAVVEILFIANGVLFKVGLRFESATLNVLTGTLLFLLPLVFIILADKLQNKWIKMFAWLWLLPTASVFSLISFFSAFDLGNIVIHGIDASYELISDMPVGQLHYRLYRTNGGATTSYGLCLRKESRLIPGLKTVELLYGEDKQYNGRMEFVAPNTLRLTVDPYKEGDSVLVKEFAL